jgi:hypothetical protein
MTDPNSEVQTLKTRLAKLGLTEDDLSWFDRLEWSDANVPAPAPHEVDAYGRREAALNADIAKLGVLEKGVTLQGRLAAAIGARLADLKDQLVGEED